MKKYVIQNWTNFGLKDVISIRIGVHLLNFKEIDEMMKILEEETWMIRGEPLFVRK